MRQYAGLRKFAEKIIAEACAPRSPHLQAVVTLRMMQKRFHPDEQARIAPIMSMLEELLQASTTVAKGPISADATDLAHETERMEEDLDEEQIGSLAEALLENVEESILFCTLLC